MWLANSLFIIPISGFYWSNWLSKTLTIIIDKFQFEQQSESVDPPLEYWKDQNIMSWTYEIIKIFN